MLQSEMRVIVLTESELRKLVTDAVREALSVRPAQPADYMTSAEVAQLLNTTPRSVQNWAKSGSLAYVLVGSEYRFQRESVLEYLRLRRSEL